MPISYHLDIIRMFRYRGTRIQHHFNEFAACGKPEKNQSNCDPLELIKL